jgi:hypothetical protein
LPPDARRAATRQRRRASQPEVSWNENQDRGDDAGIRTSGHACVLVVSRAVAIFTDSMIGYELIEVLPRIAHCGLPDKIHDALIPTATPIGERPARYCT